MTHVSPSCPWLHETGPTKSRIYLSTCWRAAHHQLCRMGRRRAKKEHPRVGRDNDRARHLPRRRRRRRRCDRAVGNPSAISNTETLTTISSRLPCPPTTPPFDYTRPRLRSAPFRPPLIGARMGQGETPTLSLSGSFI